MATVLLSTCVERVNTPTLSVVKEVTEGACQPADSVVDGREVTLSCGGEELLDYLSVVLPAVRILYDWFLCQNELYCRCLEGISQAIL